MKLKIVGAFVTIALAFGMAGCKPREEKPFRLSQTRIDLESISNHLSILAADWINLQNHSESNWTVEEESSIAFDAAAKNAGKAVSDEFKAKTSKELAGLDARMAKLAINENYSANESAKRAAESAKESARQKKVLDQSSADLNSESIKVEREVEFIAKEIDRFPTNALNSFAKMKLQECRRFIEKLSETNQSLSLPDPNLPKLLFSEYNRIHALDPSGDYEVQVLEAKLAILKKQRLEILHEARDGFQKDQSYVHSAQECVAEILLDLKYREQVAREK